jgi:hypothetical protein
MAMVSASNVDNSAQVSVETSDVSACAVAAVSAIADVIRTFFILHPQIVCLFLEQFRGARSLALIP